MATKQESQVTDSDTGNVIKACPAYSELTMRPLNQIVAILPLIVFFYIGSTFFEFKDTLLAPLLIRISMQWLGIPGIIIPSIVIMAVLFGQHLARKDPWAPDWLGVWGTIVEGIVSTLPILAAAWITSSSSVSSANGLERDTLWESCWQSVGAGVFEEFIFRLVLIQGIILILGDLMGFKQGKVMVFAIIVSAIIFSACHFLPGSWEFDWGRFTFLAIAGAWWAFLFCWRGYGVCVYSHITWNITMTISATIVL